MKESSLIEMRNRQESLARAVNILIRDVEMIKTMVMGDHQVLKQMKEFPEIIEKMKQDEQKENTDGIITGDSGSTTTGLELE